jgi:hypothetical protein
VKSLAERFWSKVNKNGPTMPHMTTACWAWTATRIQGGYGRLGLNRKHHLAHRVAWEMANGSVPAGLDVLHRCDNPPCVNVEHLFLGTQADNTADMIAKGRERHACGDQSGARLHPERMPRGDLHWSRLHPESRARGDRHGSRTHPESLARGERNGFAKLNEEKIRKIFRLRAEGWSQERLGEEFGVSRTNIGHILSRKVWAHVQLEQGQ